MRSEDYHLSRGKLSNFYLFSVPFFFHSSFHFPLTAHMLNIILEYLGPRWHRALIFVEDSVTF